MNINNSSSLSARCLLLFFCISFVVLLFGLVTSEKISLPVYRTHSVYGEEDDLYFVDEVTNEEQEEEEVAINTISKRQSPSTKINTKGNEVRYVTTIMAGDPAISYTVMLDTGNSMTALPVQGCVCKECGSALCGRNNATGTPIACGSSICASRRCAPTTKANCGFTQTLINGGSLIGYLFDTTVKLGSLSVTTTLGGTEIQNAWNNTAEGVLSLGYSSQTKSCLPNCVDNFMDALVKKNNLSNVFTLSLSSGEGMLTIGGIDDQIVGNVSYVPFESDNNYGIKIASFKFGDETVSVMSTASIQSAAPYNYVSAEVFASIKSMFQSKYSSLNGVGSLFDQNPQCLTSLAIVATYPPLYINLDGLVLKLSPQDYFVPYTPANKTVYCFGFSTINMPGMHLGDPFLRALSVVFDRSQKKIGFAVTTNTNTKSTIATGSSYPATSSGGGLSGGEIAAIVICVLIGVILIAAIGIFLFKRSGKADSGNRMLY